MKEVKKQYQAPTLTVHGNVEEITSLGGGSVTDTPMGDPAPSSP